jgi:hypothetical protein
MEPLTDVREISRIAYGFIASKALFAALNLDVFGVLSRDGKTCADTASAAGIAESRMATLLAALINAGLVQQDGETFKNAPASERYLARGARAYFGDYYRFQIDRQMYTALTHLEPVLRGDAGEGLDFQAKSDSMSDPAEAEAFSRAQHAGSLGPAPVLDKKIDLSGRRSLLDVAGGSGAFSIALCRRYPELHATILDLPNVVEVANRFIAEAELEDRIATVGGNAIQSEWPPAQDVILMSYLLSAVGEGRSEGRATKTAPPTA